MKNKTPIVVAVAIGIIFGIILTVFSVSSIVPPAHADDYVQTPAQNQLLRAQDRQARALESIASSLKSIERKMR